jgi:CRP-like cAMP-binding protein
MYFLVKGSVEVALDERLGVYAELREGCYFGENCVLGLSATRPLSVRACAWCSLFFLSQEALEDCLVQRPEAHEHFRRLVISQTVEKTVAMAVKRLKMKQLMHANPDDPKVSFCTILGLF